MPRGGWDARCGPQLRTRSLTRFVIVAGLYAFSFARCSVNGAHVVGRRGCTRALSRLLCPSSLQDPQSPGAVPG